ncbi:MAG: arginine N-succinyltransferase [Alphaproteobacteria bacterium]
MSAADYVVRPATEADLPALIGFRALTGPGFTSLSIDDDRLASRLALAARSFSTSSEPRTDQRYILFLEHVPTGQIAGLAQVKAVVGRTQPFFNFRILQIAAASAAAARRYDMDVLILVNECAGCTEVGSLFVKAEHRIHGLGRLLSRARYMLMAADPERFAPRIVSELRGFFTPDGVSPFWEALGRHFFRMDFEAADHLSATSDNQFILDLMPKYPIYVDLLAKAAQDVIGRCHPEGEGARRLLEQEGFRFDRVVDIFDGGPLLSAPRDTIRTVRKAQLLRAREGAAGGDTPMLLANPEVAAFRCISAPAQLTAEEIILPRASMQRLGVSSGARILAAP